MALSSKAGGAIASLLVALLLLSPCALALWQEDGNPVCTAADEQESPRVTSDGNGGAIITWHDSRGGSPDIYVQRVDSLGVVKWDPDGVVICSALSEQWSPELVSDGEGGAIITWYDGRSLEYHVYAQRVNALGGVEWTADGVAVCTVAGYRQRPQLAPDGAGGAIIAWRDDRNGYASVYAQRVDAQGAVKWATDGIAVCANTDDQQSPQLVSDGDGGAIIIWVDDRLEYHSIFAQRVDSLGAIRWDADGVEVCSADSNKSSARLVADGAGGAIIAWEDKRGDHLKIYAQRVDSLGVVQWGEGGVLMTFPESDQRRPQIVSDGVKGAIVAWEDSLSGDWNVYAQRVDSLGLLTWTGDGRIICSSPNDQLYPQLTTDGDGGAFVTWQDLRNDDSDIYVQHVLLDGLTTWVFNGVKVCSAAGGQSYPCLAADVAGNSIIAWQDNRSGNSDIYAMKVAPHYATDIVFASISARADRGQVVLSWCVTVDVPESGFVVRRSDARDGEYAALNIPVRSDGTYSFSCTDVQVIPGSTYWYKVSLSGPSGEEVCGPIEVYVGEAPSAYRLGQNRPNPFNPACIIPYEMPRAGTVRLRVFTASGRLLRTLVDGWKEAGVHGEVWDGRADDGATLPSGTYFYRLECGGAADSRAMVLLR